MAVPRLHTLAALLLALSATAAAEPRFVPVHRDNFPDPHVIEHQGEYIAFATNAGINLPMLTSRDLVNWYPVVDPANPKKRRDGLPQLGAWAKEGFTWAPEVMQVGGRWLLYYTASSRKLNSQCLGVAIADNPRGPYRDPNPEPMLCQTEVGGTIDANPFRDADGKLYLYFKNDGNRVGKRTALWGQQMSEDGLRVVGPQVALLGDAEKWKERVIEAPTMVRAPTGGYQMFYSAGFFGWNPESRLSPYSMGYANCSGPLGPCKDAPENPILRSFNNRDAGCISGPGHQSIFEAGGRHYVSFHAWAATRRCRKLEDERYLYVAPISWSSDGKPQIGPGLRGPAAGVGAAAKGERG